MAKSKAKKKRQHIARQTGINPETYRGSRPDFSTHTRTLPTKKARIERKERKHRHNMLMY